MPKITKSKKKARTCKEGWCYSLETWSKMKWMESRWENWVKQVMHVESYRTFKNIRKNFEIMEGGEKEYEQKEKEFKRIKARRKEATKRVRKYIEKMLKSYEPARLKFVTFDIADKYMQRDTKRKVKAWLDSETMDYIANPDKSPEKQRLHYHAVIADRKTREGKIQWAYGMVHIENIDPKKGYENIAKYVNKLSKHATKDGTLKQFHPRGLKEIDIIPW